MADLTLTPAVNRFIENERRVDTLVNGTEIQDYISRDGAPVPSVQKLIKQIRDQTANVSLPAVQIAAADGPRRQSNKRNRYVTGEPPLSLIGNTMGGGNITRWTRGVQPMSNISEPKSVVYWIEGLAELASIGMEVVARPANKPTGSDTPGIFIWPGAGPDDQILDQNGFFLLDVLGPQRGNAPTPLEIPLRHGAMIPSNVYFFTLSANNLSGAAGVQVSHGRQRINDIIDPIWKSGVFKTSDGSVIAPSNNAVVAFALYEAKFTEAGGGADARGTVDVVGDFVLRQRELINNNSLFKVYVPQVLLDAQPNPRGISAPGGFVGVERPPISAVNDQPGVLTYNGNRSFGKRYVDNITIKMNGNTLVEGVDYSVNRSTGEYLGLKNVAEANITFSFDWAPDRYDLLVVNPTANNLLIAKGTERIRDPGEYLPKADGYPSVAMMHVTRNQVQLIPTFNWSGYVRRGREAEISDMVAYNRKCSPMFMRKLEKGLPIKLGGYGDSQTAMGAGTPYLSPNGQRDLAYWYADLPQDTQDKLIKYNGDAGANAHIRAGWNWHFMRILEKRYGSVFDYRNWGIPGTDSSNSTVPGVGPNGSYPDRLNAYVADNCDMTVLAFGMNSLGSPPEQIYLEHRAIIEAIQANNKEVYVLTVPRPNQSAAWVLDDWWMGINNAIVRAAKATHSAYCDLSWICGPGNEGGMLISGDTACVQNQRNHPGIHENMIIGGYMSEFFIR